jgi:hydrogenase maturation protein HypF
MFGIVQGVGFRPFVDRVATRVGVSGTVSNRGSYVEVFAEGSRRQLDELERALAEEAPARSAVLKTESRELGEGDEWPEGAMPAAGIDAGERAFRIVESEREAGAMFVSPDIAVCDSCKAELFDPSNRRYLHPFINCTACGPRVTILDSMPYDRERTSMGEFPMCPECAREYADPASRRYDAQPVCCNDCGPEVFTLPVGDGAPSLRGGEAITYVRGVIGRGGIVAIKGVGGFHLCCDATNEQAVSRLRALKDRPFKPLAVMARDLDAVRRECVVLPGQEEVLDGPNKPILLLARRDGAEGGPATRLAASVAPDNPNVGVMLPYAPVQLLVFDYPDGKPMSDCLVMTSANPKGAPICRDDADVLGSLGGMCDAILTNDRAIRLRADDSVMAWHRGGPYMQRRSRGYAPLPCMVDAPLDQAPPVLAIGGELKNAFCLTSGGLMYMAPYVGDLSDVRSVAALSQAVARMSELLEIAPEAVVCDAHPLYNSRALAHELAEAAGIPVVEVQHHYAHVLACMAENDWLAPAIGVAFDGTGYGDDATVWGGEFLLASTGFFERMGHLGTFSQAGGDLAAREGWRVAVALLIEACDTPEAARALALAAGICEGAQFDLVRSMIASGINSVASSSAGRVFDAASAALGLRLRSTCESEAAMVLEFAAERHAGSASREPGPSRLARPSLAFDGEGRFSIPVAGLVAELAAGHAAGQDVDLLAYGFHEAMAAAVVDGCVACRRASGLSTVALSGGVMGNVLFLDMCERGLEREGFRVLRHAMYPPNDGGIALGQALFGMARGISRDDGNDDRIGVA